MMPKVLFFLCVLYLGPAPREPGITAEKWLNRLTVRHDDSRTVVILFFDSSKKRELGRQVERLNRLSVRSDVLVLGVTPEREEAARRFMKKFKPRFAVGVRSSSYRAFGVKRYPTVVVLKDDQRQSIADFDEWDTWEELLGPAPEEGELASDELTIGELQAKIEKDDNPSSPLIEDLRIRMEPEAFVQFCDDLVKKWGHKRWLGNLYYQRHLADPSVKEKQPLTTPAGEAFRRAKREGTRKIGEWRELLKTKDNWSADEIFDLYQSHAGDSDEDFVYRSDLADALGDTGDLRYVDPLLDMLDVEPDGGIRSRIIGAISRLYDDDRDFDPEVIKRLEAHLAVEDNIRWARPMLEMVLEYARHPDPESKTRP